MKTGFKGDSLKSSPIFMPLYDWCWLIDSLFTLSFNMDSSFDKDLIETKGIIIIPFVFWGMGSVFSGGNTNNVAKINNEIISTQDFVNYINRSQYAS